MKFFKIVFDFYINSSIHVALAVCALVGITILESRLRVPNALWGFIFFGCATGYNFVKYAKIAGLHHRSLVSSLKAIQVFSFLCFLLLLYFMLQLSFRTLCVAGAFALLTVFYAVPLFRHKNLRTFFGLKIFIVAMVWAGATVIVPFVASEVKVPASGWLVFAQRFFIVIALTLPFEIRDLRYDAPSLGTLPQRLGAKRAKGLGIILLVIVLVLELFKQQTNGAHLLSLVFACLLAGAVLLFSKREQSKHFASFWVEGIPILWLLVLFLLNSFWF